jgi:hypothetical protein
MKDLRKMAAAAPTLLKVGATVGVLGVAAAAVYFIVFGIPRSSSADPNAISEADTPPAEYLYLDSERVFAYLGQLLGGLSASQTRSDSIEDALTANVKGGSLAELSRSQKKLQSVQEVVTPTAADRFYRLLIVLRQGKSRRPSAREANWLFTLDGHPGPESYGTFKKRLTDIHEGDFVRIVDAHLVLPPFAAFLPKTRYATPYTPPRVARPKHFGRLLDRPGGARELSRYRKLLGANPTLPFVLPVRGYVRLTVFVPARYEALFDNPRLLSGNLTVVGKVIFKDPRLPGEKPCRLLAHRCDYVDRQTIASWGSALAKGPPQVRQVLGVEGQPVDAVRAFVRFGVPVMVVLPIAIYQ